MIQVNDSFTWTGGGGPYTVTSISPPAFGLVNVFFTPNSPSIISSGTVSSGSGGAGTGSLINSIAGAAGTDPYGNAYPEGLFSQQVVLSTQTGAVVSSFANSSLLYTSTSGRLRYISEAGANMVLDRSVLNLANKTMTTQSTPTVLSSSLSYLANEAAVGSEYELEIDGTITTPTSVDTQFVFSFFQDGSIFGAGSSVTLGAVMLTHGQTFAYTLRCRATVEALGGGGTCTIAFDGGTDRMLVAIGNIQAGGGMTGSPIHLSTVNNAFDTTANHTLAIYGNWASSNTGASAVTLRTKITRRN